MKNKVEHLPVKFMVSLYLNILGRFLIYGAYGYAVSVAFSYIYYNFIDTNGIVWNSKEACPLMPYSAIAFALVIGYFAVRDVLENHHEQLKLAEKF